MPNAAVDNRTRLLAEAKRLLQSRGFNAFSFRDLAAAVGIKSASVHHHFATKEDLGVALVQAYALEVARHCEALDAAHPSDPLARLEGFVRLFEATAASTDRMCVAGMLASDFTTLGDRLQAEVRRFFVEVERWLARQASALDPSRPAEHSRRIARLALATLEGSLLSARVFGDAQRMRQTGVLLLRLMQPAAG